MASNAASLLGGPQVLRTSPRSARDWHRLILAGVPVRAAESLKESIGVPDSLLAGLLGISEKTLSRARKAGSSLDPVASDRLFRAARIAVLARDVLEDREAAAGWLKRPQPGLGNRVPLELMTTSAGAEEVQRLLLRIEHGVYT
jgi:putative toxin-antitoxin system antitoxin component (TIGR02293 family)